MNTLPLLIRQYLSRLWLDAGKFAYLSFNKQGFIQSWHPNIEYYGVIDLKLNDHINEKLIFLEGWFSSDQDHDIFVLDFVNFEHGIIADIHILPSTNETYVLFVDVSEKFRQHQCLQQERHNFDLLNQQQVKNIAIFRQNFLELDAKKQQIETINASKNKLLSCVTDDLRTPLSAILGFTQFLGSGVFGDLNPKQQDCVDNMLKAGSYMTGLINEILEVARLEKGDLELCIESSSVKSLIDGCLQTLAPLIKAHDIKLINRIDSDINIEVDRKYFQYIITNLIDNAVKYNKKQGCIILSHRVDDEKLYLYIKDTGIGISLDRIDQIFQPFVRNFDARKKQPEKGIGLSGCKRLLGLMSGSLNVRSALSVGSVFYLDIPLSTPCEGRDKYHISYDFVYFYDDDIHFTVLKNLLVMYENYQLEGYHYSEDIHSLNLQESSKIILLDVDKNDVLFKLKLLKLLERTDKSPTVVAVMDEKTDAANIRYILEETLMDDYLTRPFDFNQLLDIFEQ